MSYRSLVGVAALLALGAAPAAGQAPTTARGPAPAAALRVPYVIDTLDNGLTLIVHEDHSAPVATVNVWYHVGSGDEKFGRTGFAHLFEHLMFMGSEHAPYPEFDRRLEAAGSNNNGSTTEDRTNYFESGPANALPLMLWLEADRMGWMLPTMDSAKVDLQRDVVKNERRQRVDNQPYGLAGETLGAMLYPKAHPYSWPVIGSMTDLSAASLEDVKEFFRRYYAPNNASIVVAGDVKAAEVKALVQKYFGAIPRGPAIERPRPADFKLGADTAAILEDRVQLPRLYYSWPTEKGWTPDDAALSMAAYILTGAKNSRLTQKLVYDLQIASGVSSFQDGKRLDGGKSYRLRLPANVPVAAFWSLTLYDTATRSMLQNERNDSALSSYDDLKTNPDGSIDLFFAPEAPAGSESNWIPTVPGKGFYPMLRFYTPKEGVFDGTWKLPDLEVVK